MIGFISLSLLIFIFSKDLPDPNKLSDRQVAQSTKIYDRTGEHVLYEIYQEEKRTLVGLDEIAPSARDATIAIEDKHFYEHKGIRIVSIVRAAVNNLLGRDSGGGGASTLTQQLIKKTIVGDEHSYFRKLKEAILAIRLEKKYTKEQILQLYLNEIPYGSTNYGIESAAQSYFHKSARDLKIHESATLAALIQAPTRYLNDHETLKGRRDLVINLMAGQGYISEEEKEEALAQALEIYTGSNILAAPHFVLYVKQLLAEEYGEKAVETGGLKVITTLDYDLQQKAENVIKEIGEKNLVENNANNAALVSIDPKNGQILAMVGSRDFYDQEIDGQYNVAVLGKRQPGSSLKPFIYTAAWERGFTPETVLYDVLTDFEKRAGEGYVPKNYDGKERGLITMKSALQGSLNIPAVKTMYLVGIPQTIEFLEKFGYTTLSEDSGLSLVLGGSEVNLLEHTNAYATLANEGRYNKPVSILKVENGDGEELFEWDPTRSEKAVEKELAYLTSNILSDNEARAYAFGLVNNLTLPGRPVAAKTGTTNDSKDAWTLGYTPSLTTGVWVGNTTPSTMKGGGHTLAAPIWQKFMSEALAGQPVEEFPEPPKNDARKPVLKGENGGIVLEINKFTEKLAASTTPTNIIIKKTYLQPHTILHYVDKNDPRGPVPADPTVDPQYEAWEEALQDWVKRKQSVGENLSFEEPPTEYDDPELMGLLPTLEFIYPQNDQLIDEQNITFQIKATAPRGIARVVYNLDGIYIGAFKKYPFDLNYTEKTLNEGSHRLYVLAEDDLGNRIKKEIVFHIKEKTYDAPIEEILYGQEPNQAENNSPAGQAEPETFGVNWDDGNEIELTAADFPRKMYLTPTLYEEEIKDVKIFLKRPDGSEPHIYTFTPGVEALQSGKLYFTWKNSPGKGESVLTAVVENKDGEKKESKLVVSI